MGHGEVLCSDAGKAEVQITGECQRSLAKTEAELTQVFDENVTLDV